MHDGHQEGLGAVVQVLCQHQLVALVLPRASVEVAPLHAGAERAQARDGRAVLAGGRGALDDVVAYVVVLEAKSLDVGYEGARVERRGLRREV